MSRDYQRKERDWRRQQPALQEEDRWSASRSDDDFSMGLGQESRGSRREDYGRRSGQEATGRWSASQGMRRTPEHFSGYGDKGFQNSRSWQRSEDRDSEGEFGSTQRYSTDPNTAWKSWNERFEGLGGRGWYEGVQDAMHRGEGPFAGRGPRNYKRSDDRIEEDINEQLTRHGRIDATDIEVSVQNGEVTLRGSVDNRQAKRMAEDIAYAVSGVKDVANQIKVKQWGESGDTGENKDETEATGKPQRGIS